VNYNYIDDDDDDYAKFKIHYESFNSIITFIKNKIDNNLFLLFIKNFIIIIILSVILLNYKTMSFANQSIETLYFRTLQCIQISIHPSNNPSIINIQSQSILQSIPHFPIHHNHTSHLSYLSY
jgi:hypothetical protein